MEDLMMNKLNTIIADLGVSKVRLAKYLGVSRQMLYNYLAIEKIGDWPKEKAMKLLSLLGISEEKEIDSIKVDGNYIMEVEGRLNEGVKSSSDHELLSDLKGFNKKEQEVLSDIFNLLKEKLSDDKTKNAYNTLKYLYNFLQSTETTKELNYILAYISKSMGFTDPMEFVYNNDQQFIFESILFSAMTLYNNGGASKSKLSDSHKRFVQDIEHKKEEKLSRTQELNTAKVQALKELGYTSITEENAKEVLEKIAEIQSRKV
jgi:DNA-binding XRE family transcriptional regulator